MSSKESPISVVLFERCFFLYLLFSIFCESGQLDIFTQILQ